MSHETELESCARGRVGRVLRSKYRLDALIGVGGMAAVYRATHRNTAEYALKMLHTELSIREDVRTRFVREGYAANSVKHPGVVRVVDDDVTEDGVAFLVMELLDGLGCEAVAKKCGGKLEVREVCAIGYQILDVLVAAHGRGVIHRDLKPANVFLTNDGRVKVLDFGVARVRDVAASTAPGTLLGTPAFMGPEQARAQTSRIDARSDVWAVGATLFTLLTDASVHEGENGQQITIKAATQRARSISTVCTTVPVEVAAIIDRALSFEIDDRWPDAASMRDALAAAYRTLFDEEPSASVIADLVIGEASLLPPEAENAPAKLIDGRYQIDRLLGQGGMGEVYQARNVRTGRAVAVKLIASDALSKDADTVARFKREARASAAIDSQHVVEVIDTGVDPATKNPYMVMELLQGEDLQQVLRRAKPLPTDTVLRIGAQACAGLQKAHEEGVIHRDIKTANLFLAKSGEALVVKLLDFGIAKVKADPLSSTEHQAGLTRTGALLGSPLYMSPEQARGQKTVDARTDVFSLGVVMYEALTGATPNAASETLGELILAICSKTTRSVRDVAPWVSQELASIVDRSLAIDPAARFQSADEMGRAIAALLGEEPTLTAEMLMVEPRARFGASVDLSADASPVSAPPSRPSAPAIAALSERSATRSTPRLALTISGVALVGVALGTVWIQSGGRAPTATADPAVSSHASPSASEDAPAAARVVPSTSSAPLPMVAVGAPSASSSSPKTSGVKPMQKRDITPNLGAPPPAASTSPVNPTHSPSPTTTAGPEILPNF